MTTKYLFLLLYTFCVSLTPIKFLLKELVTYFIVISLLNASKNHKSAGMAICTAVEILNFDLVGLSLLKYIAASYSTESVSAVLKTNNFLSKVYASSVISITCLAIDLIFRVIFSYYFIYDDYITIFPVITIFALAMFFLDKDE